MKNKMFEYLGVIKPTENMSEEELKLEDRRRIIRVLSMVFVMVGTIFLAVAAGIMIALWDTSKSAGDLVALMNGTYVYAKTQQELELVDDQGGNNSEADSGEELETGFEVVNEVAGEEKTDSAGSEGETASGGEGEVSAGGEGEAASGGESEALIEDIEKDSEASNPAVAEEEYTDDTEATLYATSNVNVYVDPNVNYPIPYGTVDESYFNDALFIGDSRLQGFGMYSGLPGTYYAATGFQLYKYDSMNVVQTDSGKVPIFSAMPYDTFTKIYIKVGLNEMGGNETVFKSKYTELIAKLRECEPRAVIYIHGLLPVTAAKSQSDKVHSNNNVIARNEFLKTFATEQNAYYIDIASVFTAADGYLPAEMAADGIHLKAQYMSIWKDYLMKHAVVLQ
ncbi:MAG: hypothetical protein K6E98_01880 [Lachnospiraceae bacterium]|nr:hypothetical protein [Lachnospiraceae bacterium]